MSRTQFVIRLILGALLSQRNRSNCAGSVWAQLSPTSSPQSSPAPCVEPLGTPFAVEADIPSQKAALDTLFAEVRGRKQ